MLIALAAILAAPATLASITRGNLTRGCIERFDPAVDYFPDKATVDDAANFKVEYHRAYKAVTVKDPHAGGPPERYVLLQCGAALTKLEAEWVGAQTVRVPVTSVFAASPTHIPVLADLGRLDVLSGVRSATNLAGADIGSRVPRDRVLEFAAASVIDTELVVASRPSLFLTGGVSNPALATIRNAGVPVVTDVEWLESTALARAEWLKYVALFLNEERTAQTVYSGMKDRYLALRARAATVPRGARPLVMTGRSTRGAFAIAGGRSYVAALIEDAGGRYIWEDNAAVGSATVDFEAQVQRASNADVWINGGGWASLTAMLEDEPRYSAFKAFRQKQVWVYERRLTRTGSNDYWSRSVTHPDLVLADLVRILHPTLLPAHEFEWYMRVPER